MRCEIVQVQILTAQLTSGITLLIYIWGNESGLVYFLLFIQVYMGFFDLQSNVIRTLTTLSDQIQPNLIAG